MIAVRVGRHSIRRKPISQREPCIAMASRASLRGDVCRIERRGRIPGIQNQVLAMTVRAIGRIARAVLQGRAMHAFVELPGNLFVALRASPYDIPVADFRLSSPRRLNSMAAVAIGARCGVFALQDGAAMHALEVPLDGMQHGDLVPGEKSGIGVTSGAGRGLISPRHR